MRRLVGPAISRREGLADRFPMRRTKPFLCQAGRFYLYFQTGLNYFRHSCKTPLDLEKTFE
jgi:hypothetical protein